MLALALLLAAVDPADAGDPAPLPLAPSADAAAEPTDAVKDAAIIMGAVSGGLLGGLAGGAAAAALFLEAMAQVQARDPCENEGCEGYSLTVFVFTPVAVLTGAAVGLVAGAVGGGWVGSELADADWTTPEPIED